jgi:hypothetical protein
MCSRLQHGDFFEPIPPSVTDLNGTGEPTTTSTEAED